MLVANFADLHARGKDLALFRAQWEAALDECDARGVELITIAGDIFDRANIHDNNASTGAVVRAVAEPLKQFLSGVVIDADKDDRHCIMIVGNHDKSGAGSEDALAVFDAMERVTVAREPKWVGFGMLSIFCLPWIWSGNEMADNFIRTAAATSAGADARTLLLAHCRVTGALLARSITHEGGEIMSVSRDLLESLPFDRIALGDFHARQELTPRGGYVGALRQMDFGEADNPQGFEIWDTETGEVEWIELDECPPHRTIEVRSQPELVTALLMQDRNERLRVQIVGFEPDRATVATLEERGAAVELHVTPPERTTRLDEVPAGILDRPHDILDTWNASQAAPAEGEELAALHTELDWLLQDVAAEMPAPAAVEATIDELFQEATA